jgi:hypothetical protein
MALLAYELDDVIHHEQGCLMATVPIHDDRAEHDLSANHEALDAQAIFSLEEQRVRGEDAAYRRVRSTIRSRIFGRL